MSAIIVEIFNEIEFPEELLLLGSGIPDAPQEWLALPSVRFNFKSFEREEYNHSPIFCHVIQRRSHPRKKALRMRGDKQYPILQLESPNSKRKLFVGNNMFMISYKNQDIGVNFGKWFLQKQSLSQKRFTTGFFAAAFLIFGKSKNYYITGFSGHGSEWLSDPRLSKKMHDLHVEYRFLLEAADIARSQGKKVYFAQDFKGICYK